MTRDIVESEAEWVPVVEERDDTVHDVSAAALHGLLDIMGEPPALGTPLPVLWHWLAFLPNAPERELGQDGHPLLGNFMPPTTLPRRMFASARIEFLEPITVGGPLHRRSVVTDVATKSGRSGELVFVEVTHEISSNGNLAILERQQLVYRSDEASNRRSIEAASPRNDLASNGEWEWQRLLPTDPRLLFRFSALTYNTHRIHYDQAYATEVEGYPGLVVHGPLQAIALARLCGENVTRSIAAYEFRALRPAFVGSRLQLRGRASGTDEVELAAFDDDGQMTVRASVTLR
jgi:3-methylfumaryl-CoA hydratase